MFLLSLLLHPSVAGLPPFTLIWISINPSKLEAQPFDLSHMESTAGAGQSHR